LPKGDGCTDVLTQTLKPVVSLWFTARLNPRPSFNEFFRKAKSPASKLTA
jgi:hypothetical protein